MPDIHAVVTDLDGTVLDENRRASAATAAAAADLAGLRIPLIVATARGPHFVATLGAVLPAVRVAVCCGGAVGWVPAAKGMLWRDTIAPNVVDRIIRHGQAAAMATYDAERWRVTEAFAGAGPARYGPVEVVAADRLAEDPVCAMSICEDGDQIRALLAGIGAPLVVDRTEAGLLNIGPAGTDKARGVRRALDAVGVDPAHAIAFGNAHADLPMFEACGYSVAVANGPDDVIAAATYVAACVHDDGFARTLGQLGLTRAHEPTAPRACACPEVR